LVFRTDIASANFSASAIRSVRADRIKLSDTDARVLEPLAQSDVDQWRAVATQFAAAAIFLDEAEKVRVAERFGRLKSDFQTNEQDGSDQAKWRELEQRSLVLDADGAKHHRRLAEILGDLACGPDGAPYLAIGLIRHGRLAALGDQLEGVRNRMKDGRKKPDDCKGVAGFTEADWRALDAISRFKIGRRRRRRRPRCRAREQGRAGRLPVISRVCDDSRDARQLCTRVPIGGSGTVVKARPGLCGVV
jgi:hypothetical protein